MTLSHIDRMKDTAQEAFDRLIGDPGSVTYVDFPDHANVGDSAIALGLLTYLERRGVPVLATQTIGTHSPERLKKGDTILAHGGGNLGDLYPSVTAHRAEIFEQTPSDKLIIQAPQTAHFSCDEELSMFTRAARGRARYRIGARDNATLEILESAGVSALLAPDSAHFLGELVAPKPTLPYVVIARTDDERLSASSTFADRRDWLHEPLVVDVQRTIRNRARKIPLGNRLLNRSTAGWKRLAASRVERGLQMVGTGEVVITDRLHAMLLGLQAGRSVIAVDNSYGKVHGYIDSWLQHTGAPVFKAESFREAQRLVRRVIKS